MSIYIHGYVSGLSELRGPLALQKPHFIDKVKRYVCDHLITRESNELFFTIINIIRYM